MNIDENLGKILFIDFLLENFTPIKNDYDGEIDYYLDTKYLIKEPNFKKLSDSIPYILNNSNFLGNKIYPKDELIKIREQLYKEI